MCMYFLKENLTLKYQVAAVKEKATGSILNIAKLTTFFDRASKQNSYISAFVNINYYKTLLFFRRAARLYNHRS